MCWCNPSLRTPCCGGISCHPCSSNISNNTKLNVSEPLSEDKLTLLDSETGEEILKKSSLVLWQNYCEKKQECGNLKEIINSIPSLIKECTEKSQEHDNWGFPISIDRVDGELLATKLLDIIKEKN